MPADWEKIRLARADVTDWLIHWTRGVIEEGTTYSAFDRLKQILQCGYLRPTFAPRESKLAGGTRNTIQGPDPAVCFTDQPLWAFINSCNALSSRYQPYAIAVQKINLFIYGGRPVIYGDKGQLARMHPDEQYTWVRYDLQSSFGGYPIDWTHEREWRSKVKKYVHLDWRMTPDEGVPLVLPPIPPKYEAPLPVVIVRTVEEATEMKQWLAELPDYSGGNGFIGKLYENRRTIRVIALNFVAEKLQSGDRSWARLDSLPVQDDRSPVRYEGSSSTS